MLGVSSRSLVHAAARNNAEWCDAFSRTHGIVGSFDDASWSSSVRTPPYFPDAVTLLPEVAVEHLLSGIDAGEGCSVKDSFACLDLDAAGFRPLFRAEWVVGQPARRRPEAARGWAAVTSAAELRGWEAAWEEMPAGSGFFQPALLKDETIAVLARYDGDRVGAGAIANRSAHVVGLSNVFAATGGLDSAWAAGAAVVATLWGDLATVGYGSGDALSAAHSAGFTSIGELVVWLNEPSSGRDAGARPPSCA